MAAFCVQRAQEITDSLIEILTTIIKRIDNRAEKRINQELIEEFKKVSGKTGLLYRIAEVSIAEPSGVIEQVIFPVVSLKTLKDLVAEYTGTGLAYKRRVHNVMRASFANHYRRMIPQLLELLEFCSNNDLHRLVTRTFYFRQLAIAGNAEILVTHNTKDFQRSQLKFPQLQIKQPKEII